MRIKLISEDNSYLINYLRHIMNEDNGIFQIFKNVDLEALLVQIRREISTFSPSYIDYEKRYILDMGEPVGLNLGQDTSKIEVRTLGMENKIMWLTPVQTSKYFDKENYLSRTRKKDN